MMRRLIPSEVSAPPGCSWPCQGPACGTPRSARPACNRSRRNRPPGGRGFRRASARRNAPGRSHTRRTASLPPTRYPIRISCPHQGQVMADGVCSSAVSFSPGTFHASPSAAGGWGSPLSRCAVSPAPYPRDPRFSSRRASRILLVLLSRLPDAFLKGLPRPPGQEGDGLRRLLPW